MVVGLRYALECHFKIFQSLDTILFNIEVGNSIQRTFSDSKWPPNSRLFMIKFFNLEWSFCNLCEIFGKEKCNICGEESFHFFRHVFSFLMMNAKTILKME